MGLAVNVECSLCDTLASAYKTVSIAGGPTQFTLKQNHILADIHRRLLELRDSGLSSFELEARVDTLYEELKQVVASELVPAGPPPEASPASTTTTTAGSSSTTGSSTTSTSTTTTTTSSSTTS